MLKAVTIHRVICYDNNEMTKEYEDEIKAMEYMEDLVNAGYQNVQYSKTIIRFAA